MRALTLVLPVAGMPAVFREAGQTVMELGAPEWGRLGLTQGPADLQTRFQVRAFNQARFLNASQVPGLAGC